MDVAKPYASLAPGVETDVLVELARINRPRSGRELARLTGRSEAGVRRVLDRLVEHGLVDREMAGRTNAYTLNRDHLLAPIIERLAEARLDLIRRLREEVTGWEAQPVHISLFGSAARGDGDATSDIDLFIIRPADVEGDSQPWRDQIDSLAEAVRRWTGNHAGISEVSEEDVSTLLEKGAPVINEVRSDAINLGGRTARSLLRA